MNNQHQASAPHGARRTRLLIVLLAVCGVISGVAAIVAAVILVGGVAIGVLAAILPTLGLIRAVNLVRATPALITIIIAAAVAAAMLLTNPGANQFVTTAFLFTPVAAGETIRCLRRQRVKDSSTTGID